MMIRTAVAVLVVSKIYAVHAFSTAISAAPPPVLQTSSSSLVSDASARLDPLLTSFLLRSVREIDEDEGKNPTAETDTAMSSSHLTFSDASRAMIGLTTWDTALRKARTPILNDFLDVNQSVWPEEPLFSHLCTTLAELGLPRLVRRHPEILTSVLLGVAKLVNEYTKALRQGKLVIVEERIDDDENEIFTDDYDPSMEDHMQESFEYEQLSSEELEKLAESLASSLVTDWGSLVQGVSLLDKVFGYNHGLLDVQGQVGFGIEDGVWKHSGWESLPDLQQRLSSMPELRNLLSRLGRRPSSEGEDIRRFQRRKISYSNDDMIGVESDPSNPASVNGLTTSGSFSAMLPSEAVLLKSSFPSLRWLFLSKKAEEKLLSYELSGWTDVPTLPLRTKRSDRLPCQSGGPLVICLDTSWSMSGLREQLSKAVVLASVSAAHLQKRECRIVSFSSANNAIDSGVITCDAEGVKRMLDFLSYSFGGGTDVTGALKYAMETIDMTSSDLLLVTDGELPNPPVSTTILSQLETLRHQTGMEIHGLLIGKRESPALDSLCTEVHQFLAEYERQVTPLVRTTKMASSTSLSLFPTRRIGYIDRLSQKRYSFALRAMSNSDSDRVNMRLYKRDKRRRFDDDDDDDDIWSYDGGYEPDTAYTADDRESSKGDEPVESDAYVIRVEESVEKIQHLASLEIEEKRKFLKEELNAELKQKSSSRQILAESISFVGTGLVERDIESRLVILALISQEHVLFIGPPGTSKSMLGRRLSQLCGGPFFQRLFTKFTTPDEIFGPLSLKALENDQYVRCIEGFLPTATVAFLDEIFKANSAILNTLLTILNERQFDNGAGTRRVDCPLKCVIGASNELPESEDLDALLDRFLLRAQVSPVSDEGLLEILSSSQLSKEDSERNYSDGLDEVFRDVSETLPSIEMKRNIGVLIKDVRNFVTDTLGQYVSDRRLIKAARLLRVSAATHGRKQVDLIDVLLLQHMLWTYPQQKDALREFIIDNLTPNNDIVDQSKFLLQGLAAEALTMVKKTMGDVTGKSGAREDDLDTINSIVTELGEIKVLLEQHNNDLERHIALLDDLDNNIWLTPDEAQSVKQNCLPLAVAASTAVSEVLNNATTLILALAPGVIDNDVRSSVIEVLTESSEDISTMFSEDELNMSLKEAKRIFKGDELKNWKKARNSMT